MDDLKLIQLAKAGQSEAIGELYDRYFEALYRFFYWQTNRQEDDARDLTQDTFLSMVKSVKHFEARSSFRNWLYAIAKHKLNDWLKQKYQLPTQPLFETLADESDWIDPADQEKKVRLLELLLKQLGEQEKQVIELRYFRNFSVKETAKKLSLSESHVKVISHRALKRLKIL
jgi:RNA polymerase sigma-70 factor (ECF subfamily)